jgi:PhnB protein
MGNCREAMNFYTEVFGSETKDVMTYSQMPPDPSFPLQEADQDKIMYACVPIFGCNVMFCDIPTGVSLTVGDNISPTLGTDDPEEIRRVFAALSIGGKIQMPLAQTFWSGLFGMVQDKFGIIWLLSLDEDEA